VKLRCFWCKGLVLVLDCYYVVSWNLWVPGLQFLVLLCILMTASSLFIFTERSHNEVELVFLWFLKQNIDNFLMAHSESLDIWYSDLILKVLNYCKMSSSKTTVWFRRDLRIEDNPALAASARDGCVFPVFIWCPKEGQFYPGRVSRWWLKQSFAQLVQSLEISWCWTRSDQNP